MPYRASSMRYEVTQHVQIYGRWVLFSSINFLLSKLIQLVCDCGVFSSYHLLNENIPYLWQQALGLAYHRLGMFTAAVKVCCFLF
jgi:hypothetical protein